MSADSPDNPNVHRKSPVPALDRQVLLGFIALLVLLFILLNRIASGFFPDARLFPFVMSVAGTFFALVAFIRVWSGREPGVDPHATVALDAAETAAIYRSALAYLALFALFYFGIWVLGFRVAAGLFVFAFIRYSGQSYRNALLFALAGLLLVESIARLLQLVLPAGLWTLISI